MVDAQVHSFHFLLFDDVRVYLLLCLFLRSLFLRLWVAILWPFFFFPLGIMIIFNDYVVLELFFHTLNEALCRLEGGKVMCVNDKSGVLGNVACCLLGAMLYDEAAKST